VGVGEAIEGHGATLGICPHFFEEQPVTLVQKTVQRVRLLDRIEAIAGLTPQHVIRRLIGWVSLAENLRHRIHVIVENCGEISVDAVVKGELV